MIASLLTALKGPWWKVIYDFSSLTRGIDEWLRNAMSPFWTVVIEMLIIGVLILLFYALIGLFLVYAERKVCAFMPAPLGPSRPTVSPGSMSREKPPTAKWEP